MQIDHTYPAMRNLHSFPVHSDEVRNAIHMLTLYESVFGDLAELTYGDSTAYDLLRDQADRLARISQHVGPVGAWTLAQHVRLHAEANRLLPQPHAFNKPGWTEP